MSTSLPRRLPLTLGLAAAAVTLASPTVAHAAGTISVTPSTGLSSSASGSVVTVTGSGYTAHGTYKVGTCSTKSYGILGVPACSSGVETTADANGNISVSYTAKKVNSNAHYGIPVAGAGQPASFTCKGSAANDQCAVTITSHNGTSSTVEAQANITFQ